MIRDALTRNGIVFGLRVDEIARSTPAQAWQRLSVGEGAKGPRVYDWAAARFAVGFRDLVQATDWAKLGLPGDLGVTIALHAGPVFVFDDAVQGRQTCVGAHISRPARIVPVTS